MAIKMALLDNGVLNYGYSVAVIGVGKAGERALMNFNLPRYFEQRYCYFRTIYLNDDEYIRNPKRKDDIFSEYSEKMPHLEEKNDPLNPCKKNDWLFILTDIDEEESFNTTLKCVKAHSENRTDNSFAVLITYKKYQPVDSTLSGLFDLIIYTDTDADLLRRPAEQIIMDMTGGYVTLVGFGDIENILRRCKVMYYENEYYKASSADDIDEVAERIKRQVNVEPCGNKCIHALVSGKSDDELVSCLITTDRVIKYIWDAGGIAIFQSKPFTKEKEDSISVLYGLGEVGEISFLQAINRYSSQFPEGEIIEL